MNFLKWLVERLKERNTWLGLTGILTTAGVGLNPELSEQLVTLGVALASVIAIVFKDEPKATELLDQTKKDA